MVVEPQAERRDLARRLGAEEVQIGEELGQFALAVEAAGQNSSFEAALKALGPGGTLLLFGLFPPTLRVPLSPYDLYRREIKVVSSFTNPHTTSRAIEILTSGGIPLSEILTEKVTLEEIPGYLAHERPIGKLFVSF